MLLQAQNDRAGLVGRPTSPKVGSYDFPMPASGNPLPLPVVRLVRVRALYLNF